MSNETKQPCPDDEAAFVSELRKEASKAFTGYSGICHKAAVTIERLRAEIKELTEFTKCEKCGMTVSSNCLGCEIKRLQAEIKKLKEAANGQKEKM